MSFYLKQELKQIKTAFQALSDAQHETRFLEDYLFLLSHLYEFNSDASTPTGAVNSSTFVPDSDEELEERVRNISMKLMTALIRHPSEKIGLDSD